MESATAPLNRATAGAAGRVDLAFDRRCTSHMSAGMTLYVRKFIDLLPSLAPDLRVAFIGEGDNFDVAEQVRLPLQIARLRPRVVHVPTPFVPLALPSNAIVTIHDLIDLHYPHFGKRKVAPYYRYLVAPVVRRARAIVTDDRATVADLQKFLGVDPGRIRIVPLGVDLVAPARIEARERPFFLYVGNHRRHKNLATLVAAWSRLPAQLPADLLITGERDGAALGQSHTRECGDLVFIGTRTDAEISAFYRAARAYVHPALREGFGLPMLEAMRAGTPVIAARSSVPEVLAPYAYGFAATDVDALRALLLNALTDPGFAPRAQAAQIATRELTWQRTVAATIGVYREFLA